MGIQRFEEIHAWQSARRLVREIYAITENGAFSRDRSLRSQIERASVSTMSNIAEGFERESSKDFLHFLAIARASNAEVRSLLFVALDIGYIDEAAFQHLMAKALETTRLVTAFRKSIEHRMNTIREEPEPYMAIMDTEE